MDFLTKILAAKEKEIAALPLEQVVPRPKRPSFYQLVKENPQHMHVIGELKRASPSKGDINVTVDFLQQARAYQEAGVSAISVLTDSVFFKGSIADLQAVAQAVTVPILCKDFILDQKQLVRAKNAGASIVLLIVAALTDEQLAELYTSATDLGLEVLVETHNAEELVRAQKIQPQIIGVNNRNLKTFVVSRATSRALAQTDSKVLYVSESGFQTPQDVAEVSQSYQAVLVGEALMRAPEKDVPALVKSLQVGRP